MRELAADPGDLLVAPQRVIAVELAPPIVELVGQRLALLPDRAGAAADAADEALVDPQGVAVADRVRPVELARGPLARHHHRAVGGVDLLGAVRHPGLDRALAVQRAVVEPLLLDASAS